MQFIKFENVAKDINKKEFSEETKNKQRVLEKIKEILLGNVANNKMGLKSVL